MTLDQQSPCRRLTAEVDVIQEWSETPPDDPQEQSIIMEVNKVYQRHSRQPPPYYQACAYGNRPQNQQGRYGCQNNNWFLGPRHSALRHQNTMVANQAYTFNGTSPHPNVTYAPGTFNMGPLHQNWGPQFPMNMNQHQNYNFPQGILHPNQKFKSFTQNDMNQLQKLGAGKNTDFIIEELTKLLNNYKTTTHHIQEVQTATPSCGIRDLNQMAELPQNPTEKPE